MNILILNWRDIKHPRAGGAELRLQEVYAPLVKQGHQVTLYSCSYSDCLKYEIIDGIKVYRVGSDWTYSLNCFFNLSKWVKKHQSDIVVEDLNKLPFYTPLIYRGPKLIQMHHLWGKSIFKETVLPLSLLVWIAEKSIGWFYQKCRFSVVSLSTKEELLDLGISKSSVEVIYNGADLDAYQPCNQEKQLIIFWIGRIQKYKGPIEACKILELLCEDFSELKLVIAGEGPYRKNVEKYVKEKSLPVEFTGFINQKEKIEWFQKSAVHLQSSYKEGWGLTIIEANACGCPVVAQDTAGLRDSCQDKKTGLLYRFRDLEDGAEKIREILDNQTIRDALIENGLVRASTFSWKKNSDEIAQLLKKLIREYNEV